MNPTMITYMGLVVATGIIIWGIVTLVQHSRAHRQKELPLSLFNSWIIVRPTSSTDEEKESNPLLDAYLRGQESGYSSRSKKPR